MPQSSHPDLNKKAPPQASIGDVMRQYWISMRPIKWLYLVTVVAFIFGTLLSSVITPLYFRNFFDILASSTSPANSVPVLIRILVSILIINGVAVVFRRLGNYFDSYTSTQVAIDLRQRSFGYFIGHSFGFFSNNFTGSLVQRINRFARSFTNITDRLYYNIIPTLVRVVGILIVLSLTYPTLALVLGIWIIFLLSTSFLSARWKLKYSLLTAEADSRISASLSDAIGNHATIQLFNQKPFENERFGEVVKEHGRLWFARWNVDMVTDSIQAVLSVFIQFAVFYITLKYWGMGLATVGMFVLAQSYIISLNDDLWMASRIIRDIYESFADAKEAVDVMMLSHEIKDSSHAGKLSVSAGAIDIANVGFHFNENIGVLDGVSLNIKPGERIALIGPSGAGKSTLVKLILRLYDVEIGSIKIDGQNIKEVTQGSLRESVSFVPQDPILFHRSLKENIKYGKLDATDEEVIQAAKLAHCHEFITSFPYGYDTYVGERGVKLSGGERQRVAIARAILKNAPILILDEATSSLDSHSEILIQDALDVLMKGKTVMVIAHRLSTIRKMNRIVVLDHGKIIEEGSHDELLTKNGMYAHLWSLQSHGFLKESKE